LVSLLMTLPIDFPYLLVLFDWSYISDLRKPLETKVMGAVMYNCNVYDIFLIYLILKIAFPKFSAAQSGKNAVLAREFEPYKRPTKTNKTHSAPDRPDVCCSFAIASWSTC